MKNKKHLLAISIYTILSALYPSAHKICSQIASKTYTITPLLINNFIFPILLGSLLYLSNITSVSAKEGWIILIANIIITALLWYIIPGISTYNLIIIGIMISVIISKSAHRTT